MRSGTIWSWNPSLLLQSMKSGMGPPQVLRRILDSSMRMSSAFWFFCMKPKRSTNSRQIWAGGLPSPKYFSLWTFS